MNKTIVYETHCINNIADELEKDWETLKAQLIKEHVEEINKKFNLLLEK